MAVQADFRSEDIIAAPDFTLTDQAGDAWTLSSHRDGAVAVLFYRGDW